jgi:hypothetical protein
MLSIKAPRWSGMTGNLGAAGIFPTFKFVIGGGGG